MKFKKRSADRCGRGVRRAPSRHKTVPASRAAIPATLLNAPRPSGDCESGAGPTPSLAVARGHPATRLRTPASSTPSTSKQGGFSCCVDVGEPGWGSDEGRELPGRATTKPQPRLANVGLLRPSRWRFVLGEGRNCARIQDHRRICKGARTFPSELGGSRRSRPSRQKKENNTLELRFAPPAGRSGDEGREGDCLRLNRDPRLGRLQVPAKDRRPFLLRGGRAPKCQEDLGPVACWRRAVVEILSDSEHRHEGQSARVLLSPPLNPAPHIRPARSDKPTRSHYHHRPYLSEVGLWRRLLEGEGASITGRREKGIRTVRVGPPPRRIVKKVKIKCVSVVGRVGLNQRDQPQILVCSQTAHGHPACLTPRAAYRHTHRNDTHKTATQCPVVPFPAE